MQAAAGRWVGGRYRSARACGTPLRVGATYRRLRATSHLIYRGPPSLHFVHQHFMTLLNLIEAYGRFAIDAKHLFMLSECDIKM